ncbi:MAG: thermonuclease family protein [Phycisphaerae bacterium]|jgi:endonuclease YncB( thermonuclease family)
MSRRGRRRNIWPRRYRHGPAGALIVLLVALAVALSRGRQSRTEPPAGGPDYDRYHNRTALCTRVVDGDTLHVDIPDGPRRETAVRLRGVDTPETVHPDKPAMHFGAEATDFVKSAVLGKPVRLVLVPHDTRDRYQRVLAYVYYGQPEEMLNERLIAEGYGYADPRFKHPWREKFTQLEQQARRRKVGLWADVRPEQMPAWRRDRE